MLLAVLLLAATPVFAAPGDDVMAADRAFSALSVAKGSNAAFLAFMMEDGQLFGTGGAPVLGKAAAAAHYAALGPQDPKGEILSWQPDAGNTAGDMGWTDGHWLYVSGKDQLSGHYLTVWKKVGGSWKVQADMGTVDRK